MIPPKFQILYSRLLEPENCRWWIKRYIAAPNIWQPAAKWSIDFMDKYRIQLEFDFKYSDKWSGIEAGQ